MLMSREGKRSILTKEVFKISNHQPSRSFSTSVNAKAIHHTPPPPLLTQVTSISNLFYSSGPQKVDFTHKMQYNPCYFFKSNTKQN